MKGTITRCLAGLVRSKAGDQAWRDIVRAADAGDAEYLLELAGSDVDDALVVRLLHAAKTRLGLEEQATYDAFGEYWCCSYAPTVYAAVYGRFTSARDMILGLDRVHVDVTASMARARPPRFEYAWRDDKTLIVFYKSHRRLAPLYVGLVRGVGKYFKEDLRVTLEASNRVRIDFP
jgi:hypothetical protein